MREVARYLIEMGHLKRVTRTAWRKITPEAVESVAEHSHRATLAGFVLATLEEANPNRVATLVAFHSAHSTRLTELTELTRGYLPDLEETETSILADQLRPLPAALRSGLLEVLEEYRAGQTPESRVARDAVRIDGALQALELVAQGRNQALEQLEENISGLLTATGQAIASFLVTELRAGRLGSLVAWWKETRARSS